MWAQVMVVSTLGYCLLFAIIHFERFGGDTQKRSLGNRLSSLGAVNVCLQITFTSTIIIFIRNNSKIHEHTIYNINYLFVINPFRSKIFFLCRYDLGNSMTYLQLTNCVNNCVLGVPRNWAIT